MAGLFYFHTLAVLKRKGTIDVFAPQKQYAQIS